jgi:oxygen-dependent protoporphyrinogen oxidase
MVPQLADLAVGRSALLTARKRKKSSPALQTPIFETPRGGLTMLTRALQQAIRSMGGTITTDTKVEKVSCHHKAYLIVTDSPTNPEIIADSMIVTSTARASATMLSDLDEQVSASLATTDHASVVMVTVKTQETEIASFRGLSGYLVAKPDQDRVTAVSFGSNKWAHWRPNDGSMILRVSLGRDGVTTKDLIHEWEDERLVTQVIDEVSRHTQTAITADISRVTRWPDAFPQYRPGHLAHIEKIERSLAHSSPGVFIAGASMRGIGIPACVAQGENSATSVVEFLAHLRD